MLLVHIHRHRTMLVQMLLIATALFTMLSSSVHASRAPNFILWNNEDGTSLIILEHGIVKPVETIWTCFAAHDNIAQVTTSIRSMIAAGKVPYIQSYCFGDNGLRGDFHRAVDFDTQIARAIGSSKAFVNLDTEWDDAAVINIMKSPQGIQCFKDRINAYRSIAPNTWLLSSPGLWSPDSAYTWFKEIDVLLDMRADIFHAVSSDAYCTKKIDGSHFPSGKSLDEALAVVDKINGDKYRMNSLWGSPNKPLITADVGVTSCGWGEINQAAIINKLVDGMDCMFANSWRGAIFRNYAPDPNERAMGNQNEGQFVYSSGHNSRSAMKRGFNKAVEIMKSGAKCTAPPKTDDIVKTAKSSQYWAQIQITPSYGVIGVVLSYKGVNKALEKASWGEEWVGSVDIAPGTPVVVTVKRSSGEQSSQNINWLSTAAPTPVPAPAPTPVTPVPAPAGFLQVANKGSNEWWVQLQIRPDNAVSAVSINYLGLNKHLTRASWGSEWVADLEHRLPAGTKVIVTVKKGTAALTQTMTWSV